VQQGGASPGEVGRHEAGVQHEAHGVVQPPVLAKGLQRARSPGLKCVQTLNGTADAANTGKPKPRPPFCMPALSVRALRALVEKTVGQRTWWPHS
jgi:hypothetical protein